MCHFTLHGAPSVHQTESLGIMVFINAAPVPVALEIASLVPQLKAYVVHWGVRTIPSLLMFL